MIEGSYVRLREKNEPFRYDTADVSTVRGLFVLDHSRIALLYEVDHDVLRGSGRPVGLAVGSLLDINVSERLFLRGPEGLSVAVTFPPSSFQGPSLGSTRSLAEWAGADEGDMLTVLIDRSTQSVDVRATDPSAYQPGWGLVARLTGIDEESGLEGMSRALRCAPGDVRATLSNRGDTVVLDSMPPRRMSKGLAGALANFEAEVDRRAIS